MGVVIGIDVGGSTTKIVGFTKEGKLIAPLFVRATDPITSIYGAFGKFTTINNLELKDIQKIMVTGVGSSYITKPIYGLECTHIPEFQCIGLGGLYLSGLNNAIIVSMGTGTAIIHAASETSPIGKKIEYMGGTGVGGGTLMGLSKKLLGMEDISNIVSLASNGDLNNVDLRIRDITKKDIIPGLPDKMTAANFGNISDLATKSDVALGIINLVFESVGMLAIFGGRNHHINDIVLTGNLTIVPQAKDTFQTLNSMFKVNFIIPENSQFGTVIGAALSS